MSKLISGLKRFLRKYKKWIFPVGMGILAVLILISGFTILNRSRQTKASRQVLALEQKAVTPVIEEEPERPEFSEKAPINVDFAYLQKINPDVKAWLYCEDTPINFAIMQSTDNSYYLSHLADGSAGNYGSVFIDYRCAGDLSDRNTIIYGHDMQNGSMFGELDFYREQEYYEEHKVMYLLTPEQNYRLDAVCGFLHTIDSILYELPAEADGVVNAVWTGISRSTFHSDIIPEESDRFITLSTCAYDFDGARYAMMFRMTEIG